MTPNGTPANGKTEVRDDGLTWMYVDPPGTWVVKPAIPPTTIRPEDILDDPDERLRDLIERSE